MISLFEKDGILYELKRLVIKEHSLDDILGILYGHENLLSIVDEYERRNGNNHLERLTRYGEYDDTRIDPEEAGEYDDEGLEDVLLSGYGILSDIARAILDEKTEIPIEDVLKEENLSLLVSGEYDCNATHIYRFVPRDDHSFSFFHYYSDEKSKWSVDEMKTNMDSHDLMWLFTKGNEKTKEEIEESFYDSYADLCLEEGLAIKDKNNRDKSVLNYSEAMEGLRQFAGSKIGFLAMDYLSGLREEKNKVIMELEEFFNDKNITIKQLFCSSALTNELKTLRLDQLEKIKDILKSGSIS